MQAHDLRGTAPCFFPVFAYILSFLIYYHKAILALFFVNEDKQNLNQGGPWWKPGVEVSIEVSSWIAIPLILALFAGKALDGHFGTKPLMLLVLAGIGFLVSSFGIVRTVKKYMNKISDK